MKSLCTEESLVCCTTAQTLLSVPSVTYNFSNISILSSINQSGMEISNTSSILVVAKIGTKHEYSSLLKLVFCHEYK